MDDFENILKVVLVLALMMLLVVALPNLVDKTVREWEPQPDAHERIRRAMQKNWGINQ